ncbi:TonB-dependent receptor [Thalassomonas viridans]|uniref:TonB-dependent receptor n=1 Tax=Thalassomonas viridans TaxID=137584 RepID=A0AAE9Z3F9_9GAMM|nr:TonB-dependent receptor [Thalassomonas viridans]WDE06101.1 TonB-dependent receptor [Thalassomonas viridans]
MKTSRLALAVQAGLLSSFALINSAHANTNNEDQAIETIIVSGQKIQRSVQETKESVAVFTEDNLKEMPLFEFEDVFQLSANTFEINGGENFGLRGITQSSTSTGGGNGELGSLYIDGVAYTGFATRFGSKNLWDVEQIEILRGPQSTSVGRNALIGAIVVQTKKPELEETEGAFATKLGNYGQADFSGMFNVPITENSALRITADSTRHDGFIKNTTRDDDKYDARKTDTIRAQYLVEFSEDFTANMMVQYTETERGQDLYVVTDADDPEDRESTANLDAYENYDAFTASLHLNYIINDNLSLSSVTSFIDGDYERFNDDDQTAAFEDAHRARETDDRNWSQELRLSYQSDTLSGVAGLYVTEVEQKQMTRALANITPADVRVPEILHPFYPEYIGVKNVAPFEQDITNIAFFTEWDYQLTEKWTLSAGFRYDREEQDILSNVANELAPGTTLPDPVEAGALAEQIQPGSGAQVAGGITQVNAILMSQLSATDFDEVNNDYNAFLPQIGASYAISDDVMLSLFYKRGYRAGGVDVNLFGQASQYDPEYLDNYEFSVRSSLLDNKLTLNANFYYGDWSKQQISICEEDSTDDCYLENAGESRIYGAEVEARYNPTQDVMVFASLGLSDTKFTKYNSDNVGDLTGNTFALSPDRTFAVGTRVMATEDIYISANANYQSSIYADFQNTTRLDNRVLVNASTGYYGDNYNIELYVNNLFDEFYLNFDVEITNPDSTTHNIVRAGAPREYGVKFNYTF